MKITILLFVKYIRERIDVKPSIGHTTTIFQEIQPTLFDWINENEKDDHILFCSIEKKMIFDTKPGIIVKFNIPEKSIVCSNCFHEYIFTKPERCSVCHKEQGIHIYYCNTKCQKADWEYHKKRCGSGSNNNTKKKKEQQQQQQPTNQPTN